MFFHPFILAIGLSRSSQSVESTIRRIIEDGLKATKIGDAKKFVSSMAADAVIIDDTKMWKRQEIQTLAKDLKISRYRISEVNFKHLSDTSCVYTYRNLEVGSFKKTPFTQDLFVTTVWTKKNRKWECKVIQETNVKK